METSFAAAILLHPVALLMLVFVVFAAVRIGSRFGETDIRLPWQRLLGGFGGLVVAALLAAAASSYVSPEDALRIGVQPENYGGALLREFEKLAVIFVFVAVVGCAVIGVPLVVALSSIQLATAPVLIALSVPISLVFSLAIGLLQPTSRHFVSEGLTLVAIHALFAVGFAAGARLPLKAKAPGRNVA